MAASRLPTSTRAQIGAGDTRQRVLVAAEKVVTARGAQGLTIRAVTAAAAVSVGVVHYHFGSRDGLLQALAVRQLEAVRQAQHAALDEVLSGGAPPSIESVLVAFMAPLLREVPRDPVLRSLAPALMSGESLAHDFRAQFEHQIADRVHALVTRLLPALGADEAGRRTQLAMGLIAQNLQHRMARPEAHGQPALRDLVAFLAGGLRAPAVETMTDERRRELASAT